MKSHLKLVVLLAVAAVAVTMVTGSSVMQVANKALGYCRTKKIDSDLMSLPCIIQAMCRNKRNPWVLKDFYACYDNIPTKKIFFKCMDQAFDGQLNNVKTVSNSCKTQNLGNVLPYGLCLMQRFRAAGANMNKAVSKINKCQARVLGLMPAP